MPEHLDAPSISLHTAVRPVGLGPGGAIEVPDVGSGPQAGWYRLLAAPGEIGVAVVVGHVDSAHDGPAVFFRLGELRPGDPLAIKRSDGRTVHFEVTAVREYPKAHFPAGEVYAVGPRPELRLITCGGDFDSSTGSYQDSIVVFAALADPLP